VSDSPKARLRVVVIGNGPAGIEAAIALRRQRPDCSLTIVSEESDHPFSRTALMWIHAGQLAHRDTETHPRDLYERLGITRVRARALGIDAGARTLTMNRHSPIPFDQLLIACGSRPRPAPWPGADLLGVGTFVTHQDLAWLEEELFGSANRVPPPRAGAHEPTTPESPYRARRSSAASSGHASRRPAVVGGGLIGLEVIELALARGLRPRFFLRDASFWPIALDRRESRFLEKRMTEHGVAVHREARVERFVGDAEGRIAAIESSEGRFDVDCAVVAIGVVPNTDWLEGGPVALDAHGAIVVDHALRTNVDGVFAAGDCAAVPQRGGSNRTELLWYTARDQGRAVARAMLGEAVRYDRGIPYNTAKLMDVEFSTVGRVERDAADLGDWYHEEVGAVRSTTRFVLDGDRVVGFNALGRRWDLGVIAEFIAQERSLEFALRHLGEAAFDTEFVPRLALPRTGSA